MQAFSGYFFSNGGPLRRNSQKTPAWPQHQIRAAKLISIIKDLAGTRCRARNARQLAPVARESRASHGCQRVAASIFCDFGQSGPGEVSATDHHLIGNHPIEQLATAGLAHLSRLSLN